jgi:hypothetical protein
MRSPGNTAGEPPREAADGSVTIQNGIAIRALAHDDSAYRFEITVDVDSPFFDGHFPARPVLPAAAILWIVSRASLAVLDEIPRGFESVRFQTAVEPGVTLQLSLVRGEGAVAERFEIRSEDRVLARGHLLYER